MACSPTGNACTYTHQTPDPLLCGPLLLPGGIFALYALICRAAGIQPGGGSLAHEADMSLTQYSGSRGGRDSGAGYRAAPASEPGTPLSAASATDPSGLRARWTEWRLRTATNARGERRRADGHAAAGAPLPCLCSPKCSSPGPASKLLSTHHTVSHSPQRLWGAATGHAPYCWQWRWWRAA